MENQLQLLQALCDGKKLCNKHWPPANHFIHVKDGQIVDEDNKKFYVVTSEYNDWEIFKEKYEIISEWITLENNITAPTGYFDWQCLEGKNTKLTIEILDDK